ncbi:hypothetical protein ALC57_10441, partial [Trachymyrmex cornetzi]
AVLIMTLKYNHKSPLLLLHVLYKTPLLLQLLFFQRLPLLGSCLSSISINSSGIPCVQGLIGGGLHTLPPLNILKSSVCHSFCTSPCRMEYSFQR